MQTFIDKLGTKGPAKVSNPAKAFVFYVTKLVPLVQNEANLSLWLYFSNLESSSDDPVFFYTKDVETDHKYADDVSGYESNTLKQLKSTINTWFSTDIQIEIPQTKDLLSVNNIELGYLSMLPTSVSLEEAIEIFSYHRIRPKMIKAPDLYYSYLEEARNIKEHTIASFRDRYFYRYGSSYGGLGDIFRDKAAVEYFKKQPELEINILPFKGYQPALLKYILKTFSSRLFILTTSEAESAEYYRQTPFECQLAIFNVRNKKLSSEELDVLNIVLGYRDEPKPITLPILSRFEKVVVIGRRAKDIHKGSPLAVEAKSNEVDLLDIAERELSQKKLPGIVLIRSFPYPDKTVEKYNPNELLW